MTRSDAWREAHWEIFWMLFHGQSKADTFANIIRHGLGACDALELIRDCEREG
jgi:hypothetical protein